MDKAGHDWAEGMAALARYVEARGHARVPRNARSAGVDLGSWVVQQREMYWSGALAPDRVTRLEAQPDWSWAGASQRLWEANLVALQRYAAADDVGAITSTTWFGKRRLGEWVLAQRAAYRSGQLPVPLVDALERVPGWVWADQQERWEFGLAVLRHHVATHGTAELAADLEVDGFRLGAWVQRVRDDHRADDLPADCVAALERLPGWRWSATQDRWLRGLRAVERFAAETGHSRPPQNTVIDGFPVGMWVHNRRKDRQAGRLSPERTVVLERLPGWVWSSTREAGRNGT